MARREADVRERRREERRIWRAAMGVSVLLHLLAFVLWRSDLPPATSSAAAGPRSGDVRAAAGGARVVRLAPPAATPLRPPPVPLPAVDVPEATPVEEEPRVDLASILGDRPDAARGPGPADGDGRGDAGAAEAGRRRLVPPAPRGMIIPPADRRFRGREIEVWVFVDERGRVVPDSTRLRPPTSDGSFNRRLKEEAARWVFEPARRGGRPVASWFPYTITL